MQPIDYKQVLVVLVGAACLVINHFIPQIKGLYFDILVRSSAISIFYLASLYFMKVSWDLNDRVRIYKDIVMKKFGK